MISDNSGLLSPVDAFNSNVVQPAVRLIQFVGFAITPVSGPIISGEPETGAQLQTSNGVWSNFPTSYSYQWKRNGLDINGATARIYTPTLSDTDALLTVTVTASNGVNSLSATSSLFGPILSPPLNLELPEISGFAGLGGILEVGTGEWSGDPTIYAYQWKRNGVNIGGASAATYDLDAADFETLISAVVTATNTVGSASATAEAIGPIGEGLPASMIDSMTFDLDQNSQYIALI